VLRDGPRLFGIAQDVVGQPVYALPVLLDQRLEGREVAGTAPLDEGRFVRVHRDSLARPPVVVRRRGGDGDSSSPRRSARIRRDGVEAQEIALRAEARDLAARDGGDDGVAAELPPRLPVGAVAPAARPPEPRAPRPPA